MIQEITDAFAHQPTLLIYGVGSGRMSFAAWGIVTIPGLGRVYRGRMEYFGRFGNLLVHEGDFLSRDAGGSMILAIDIEIEGDRAFGYNWELELNSGYEILPDGDNFVVRMSR